jgi:hypothetical protein
MILSDLITQNKNYSTDFDHIIFFIKKWEKAHGSNLNVLNIEAGVSGKSIHLSNNKSAHITIYENTMHIGLRDVKTGKITNGKYQTKEQYINKALDKLFEKL